MKKTIVTLFIFFIIFLLIGCDLGSSPSPVDFTLYFDSNGGTEVSAIKTDGKSVVSMPDDPTKDGYIFGGWYWDNNTFNQPFTANSLVNNPLNSNMTVYAKWNEDSEQPIGTISVTFNSMGGTDV